MNGARVAFVTGLPKSIIDLILTSSPDGWVTEVVSGDLSEEEQIKKIVDADFLMVYRAHLYDHALTRAKKVKLVQLLSAGYDTVNLQLMSELEIPCASNGGANSWAVADHTILLMLSVFKRLVESESSLRKGLWAQAITGTNTFEMAGKVVGILGMGNIGQKVAKRVQGFESEVQYYDSFPLTSEIESSLNVTRVSLDQLFTTSDIVTCHVPLTKDTYHIVNKKRLDMMKTSGIVINTSRGQVIDEKALILALMNETIAGAGLDVFDKEPISINNPLLDIPGIVLTPHIAGTTWDTWFRRARFAYDNMMDVWMGKTPNSVAKSYEII